MLELEIWKDGYWWSGLVHVGIYMPFHEKTKRIP